MPHRIERIASQIRSVVADAILHRLSDPRIPPITSVTRVEVAPDFSLARIWVSVMAPKPRQKLCLAALRGCAGHLRAAVGKQVRLRHTPMLDFRLDESVQGAIETVQIIDRAMEELRSEAPTADGGADVDDEEGQAVDGPDGGSAREEG